VVKGFSSISSSPSRRERIEVRVRIKLLQGRLDKKFCYKQILEILIQFGDIV